MCYFVKKERNFSVCPKNLKQFDFLTVMILFDDIQQSYFFTIRFLADKKNKKKYYCAFNNPPPLYVCFLYFWWSHKTNSLYYPLFFLFLRICYYYIVWSYNQLYVVTLKLPIILAKYCQFLAKYCQFLAKYCQFWLNTAKYGKILPSVAKYCYVMLWINWQKHTTNTILHRTLSK